jgi:hypothetical protein
MIVAERSGGPAPPREGGDSLHGGSPDAPAASTVDAMTALATMDTPFGAGSVVTGMAHLTGLLGGFALAVAGLLVLAGTGTAHPPR